MADREANGEAKLPEDVDATRQSNGSAAGTPSDGDVEKKERKSFGELVKAGWAKTGLTVPTLLMMAKGGLPPLIALSMFQANAIATLFPTLGYLLGIVSILGFCIMPRAKFIQTMLLDVLGVCLGTAFAMLEIYCAVKARQHTKSSPPTSPTEPGYNSSASVVCAVWLFVQIYAINAFRAKFSQFTFPCIIYSIFVNVTSTYAPLFPDMTYGMNFGKTLLEVFLLGLGIATAVSLLILPVSMRKVVFGEFTGYLTSARGVVKAELAYFQSLEDPESFRPTITEAEDGKSCRTPQAEAVKNAILGLQALHGKLHGDLAFAKREVAFGNIGPDDLKKMYELNRKVILPTIGLSAVIDIFEHLNELNALNEVAPEVGWAETVEEIRKQTMLDWTDYMKNLHEDFTAIAGVIDEGLEHVLLVLKLQKPAKPKKDSTQAEKDDLEARAEDTRPGSKGFANYMEEKCEKFHSGKHVALRLWCEHKGIELPPDFFEHPATASYDLHMDEKDKEYQRHQRRQRQLYMLLYMEFLLHALGQGVLEYVRFADGLRDRGAFSKKRFLFPGKKRLYKWVRSIFSETDVSNQDEHAADIGGNTKTVTLGAAYSTRKDPEHLPPTNWVERFGNGVRTIPNFLRSPESVHGFRAACATLSIGIVAYLHDTQLWFVRQRGLWALIMVSISMNPTAGSSIFSFLLRILGTTLAMLLSWCIWYIPDQKTPGSLVFLWLFVGLGLYLPLKQPQFTIVGMISIVTTTLIVGYQLEARKVGIATASSNGQPYYPIYEFAPYRLATVVVGLVAAFIWTIIPYPISEHSQIRKGLGGALYLVANYYSIVHELTRARVRGDEGDLDDKNSPGRRLEKLRIKVFSKLMLQLASLRSYAGFLRWEIPIGGKFPKKEYMNIINSVSAILDFMSLVSYASQSFRLPENAEESAWSEDFRLVLDGASLTSQEVTSLLALLSASIMNGQPLPPYLKAPKPYQLSQKLEALDKDILNVRHINEPGYAAFAVMQVSTRCIIKNLNDLLVNVKAIVGELDFSFHVISTSDTSSEITLWETAKSRGKQD